VQRIYLTLLAGEPRTVLVPVEENDTETDVHRRVTAAVDRQLKKLTAQSVAGQYTDGLPTAR
jgi:hypothetical protein